VGPYAIVVLKLNIVFCVYICFSCIKAAHYSLFDVENDTEILYAFYDDWNQKLNFTFWKRPLLYLDRVSLEPMMV